MQLITNTQKQQLLANFKASTTAVGNGKNPEEVKPVVKLFDAFGEAKWLISEMNTEDHNIIYGITDLGIGFVEWGSIYLPELQQLQISGIPRIERDINFTANKTISEYLSEGAKEQRLIC